MSETIQYTAERLAAFISQNYSDIETAPGSVINELLIKLAAAIQNEQYNKISELDQGNSIKAITESSVDTYSPIIDEVASNYNTVRGVGRKSIGKIKVTVSEENGYILQQYSLTFNQPSLNLNYVLSTGVRVSINPKSTLQEIQLHSDNGLYYFIVDVEAEDAGTEYQVSSGTPFELGANDYVANFVKAEAYGNFSSGEAIETDKQLVAKIKNNIGNSRLESAAGIANKFRQTFTGFQTLSVCGANDAEMIRSKQNIMGISTFGKADVYVRSSLGLEFKRVLKSAKKISDTGWELTMASTDIPGFYHIKSILPKVNNVLLGGTLIVTSTVFGTSLYTNQRNNELLMSSRDGLPSSYNESRFTKYQTATIQFNYDGLPSVAIGDTATFEVTANYQPNVLEMQDLLLSDDYRLACADYLVKAVIPCMVSLKIKLLKKRPVDTYDSLNLQNLKKDIFTYINTIPFGAELHASNIVDICHNYGIKRVDLPITMTGIILCPDGSTITLENEDVLAIPQALEKGVTPKTTLYFIDYYKVENGETQAIDNIDLGIA